MLILLDISLAFHDIIIIRPAAVVADAKREEREKIATELLIWR